MNSRTFAALVLCLVSGCGPSDPRALTDAGSKTLNSGDYSAAAANYEQALAKLGVADPDWKRAKMGLFQARADLDPARAKDEFLEFAKANPTQVSAADFTLIASRLGELKAAGLGAAVAVLKVGKETYKEARVFDELGKSLHEQAESSGNSDATKAIESLGYVGGK